MKTMLLVGAIISGLLYEKLESSQSIHEDFYQYEIADIDLVDPLTKKTALLQSVEKGDLEAVKSLVSRGANVNLITKNYNAKTCPLFAAVFYPEILKFLIDSGADVNIQLSRTTSLHHAVRNNCYESVCILLDEGADVNARDLYQSTPLHLGMGNKKTLTILLDHGADMHAMNHDKTSPLHWAYQTCNLELLKEFVARGGSVNEFDKNGCNALHYACHHSSNPGAFGLIKYLIEEQRMNLNQNGKHSDGTEGSHTPFSLAIDVQPHLADDFEILDYLVSKGGNFQAKFYAVYGTRVHVIHNSILSFAVTNKSPQYVIDWMIANGAKP